MYVFFLIRDISKSGHEHYASLKRLSTHTICITSRSQSVGLLLRRAHLSWRTTAGSGGNGGWGRLVLHSAAAGVYFALTGCLRADTPRTSCINTTWEILYREYTSTIERFCCSTRRYCMRRIILCVPHRARTGPAQGPHRARTGPAQGPL